MNLDAPELHTRSADDIVQPHLRPGEVLLWTTRPSLYGLVPIFATTLAAAAGIVVPIYLGIEDRPAASLLASTTFLFAFGGLLVEFVRKFVRLRYTVFAITKDRFYSVTSFFSTTVKSVPLSRVTHVTLHQGVVARMFGLWSAKVSAYGEAGTALDIPAIKDGERLLGEASAGLGRGANAHWLVRGD